jgi:alkylation response protein AidB-like acyl-CoA dehydrogenase
MGFDEILAAAKALSPTYRERAEEIDAARRLPDAIVNELRSAGAFRMTMPREWGGPELTSLEQIEVIEEYARGNPSVGWCVSIGADAGLYSSWLDESVARRMFPRLDMVQAGSVYPIGRAIRIPGGFEITGRWVFGSGCQHCDWLAAGCWVYGDRDEAASGRPSREWRIMLATPDQFDILDTWDATGLRGTGSTDFQCDQLLIPEEQSFSFLAPPRRAGTLYAGNEAFLRKMAGVPLGLARAVLDDAVAIVDQKRDRELDVPYRAIPRVQSAVGEAVTMLGAARAFVFDSVGRLWDRFDRGEIPSKEERAAGWLARLNAFRTARTIAEMMYDVIGGSAVYTRLTPFDRYLRDAYAMSEHVCGQSKGFELVGAMLLDPAGRSAQPFLDRPLRVRRRRARDLSSTAVPARRPLAGSGKAQSP